MKTIKIITILFFLCKITFSQGNDFPQLNENSFENIKIEISKFYNGESLWGLINGGADLYLEYGFDKLLHQQVTINNNNYRIEIYRMVDSLSAFGIFSISKFKCDSTGSNNLMCITKYQTQGVKGSYYLSISNSTGDSDGKKVCAEIFEKIADQIMTESEIDSKKLFAEVDIPLEINNVKLIKGQLGIQNGYPIWTDVFEGLNNFQVTIYPFDYKGEEIVIGEIRFANENDLSPLINKKESLAQTLNIKKLNNDTILLTDSKVPVSEIYALLNLQ